VSRYRSKHGNGRSPSANQLLIRLAAAPGPLPLGGDVSASVAAELVERGEAQWVRHAGVRAVVAVRR
jgi:hypothetical protein